MERWRWRWRKETIRERVKGKNSETLPHFDLNFSMRIGCKMPKLSISHGSDGEDDGDRDVNIFFIEKCFAFEDICDNNGGNMIRSYKLSGMGGPMFFGRRYRHHKYTQT